MPILSSGKTDVGRVRKSNQDSIYLNPQKNLFIVADGMGGHNGGDIASQMAVKFTPEYLLGHMSAEPIESTSKAIEYANKAILKRSRGDELLKGMGTTVVLLYFKANNLFIGNVGDSRAYLVSKGKLFQMSRDHSLVHEKLNMGLYTREEAHNDKHKNILVRTVGYEDQLEVDVFTYKVKRNDIFLICSDGLHGEVSDPDILEIVNRNLPSPDQYSQHNLDKTVEQLIHQACTNGGKDNVSVIMAVAV